MANFRDNKVQMFGERETVDQAVDYASKVAGPEGVTVAMVMYNTVMEVLEQQRESQDQETSES